jgi:TolB protein
MRILVFLFITFTLHFNCYSQSKLVFAQSKGKLNTGGTPDLMIYDVDTKKLELLYKGAVKGRGEYSPSFSPDNSKVIVNTYQFGGWKLGITDYKNGKIGEFKKFTSRSTYEYNAKWSNDGAFVAYQDFDWSTRDTEIFIADSNGKNTKRVTISEGGDRNPCWSLKNKSIIFTSGREDNYDIYIQSMSNQKAVNITNNPSTDFAPSTSNKEEKIAFLSDREGSINLYTINYDGKGLKNLTGKLKTDKITINGFESSGCWAYQTACSKDGNHIVFNVMINSNLEIFTVKKDGTELTQITNNVDSDICPTWL